MADLGDSKQHGAARVDERAHIHVAQRDDAIERRLDHAIALHFFQSRHVRLRRVDIGALDIDGLLERFYGREFRIVLGLRLIVVLF